MSPLLVGYGVLSAGAILFALLLGLRAYENRRHFLSRLRHPIIPERTPSVALIVPCKGIDLDFDAMVTGVLTQDYPDYRVAFVVESKADPAWARLAALLPRFSGVATQLIVAGTASDCGQKVHNLLAATETLPADTEVLAFMDSDIHPASDWLSRLVSNLSQEKFAAATGYRWFVPQERSLASSVLAALNAPIAGMLGNHGMNVVWGGTWAIRRSTFDALRIRERWRHTLSDDLVVHQALRDAGLYTAFEPACLVPSPARFSWGGLLEFARRQYLITRVYVPRLWLYAVAGGLWSAATFWGGLLLFAIYALQGAPLPWLLLPPTAFYTCNSLRAWMRQSCMRGRLAAHAAALRPAAWLDIVLHPVLSLLNLGCLLSAGFGRTITWRSIQYHLVSPRQTRITLRPSLSSFPFSVRVARPGK
jgi:cellulose synthase/poly-beta-1,6-N-acetylglucosamine synthase-like glycosyltransferase